MSTDRWYYQLLSEEFGPVPTAQLLQLVSDGTLSLADSVRAENSKDWITVSSMQQLAESESASEIADLSELSFSFEDTSTDSPDELDINTFEIEESSSTAAISASSAESRRRRQKASAVDDEDDAMFYVRSSGKTLGPMTLQDLVAMANAATVSATDQVRLADEERWLSADSFPEVAAAFINVVDEKEARPAKRTRPRLLETVESPASNVATDKVKVESTDKSAKSQRRRSAPAGKRPVKKKRRKQDELLKEIFSEVFTEDETTEKQRRSAIGSESTSDSIESTQPSTPATESAGMPTVPTPASPSPPPMATANPTAQNMADAALAGTNNTASAAIAAAARHTPPAKKKKRRGGAGFSMPQIDPKILGGIVVIAALIGAGASGLVPIPGLSFNGKSAVSEFYAEYKQLAAGTVTEAQWKDFRTRVQAANRQINSQFNTAGAEMTPEDFKLRGASQKLGMLVSTELSNKEGREKAFAEVERAMAAIK